MSEIDFVITEIPEWRTQSKTTSSMVQEILNILNKTIRKDIPHSYMVHSICIGESLGITDFKQIELLIQGKISPKRKEEYETRRIYEALDNMWSLLPHHDSKAMEEYGGLLDIHECIIKTHTIIMGHSMGGGHLCTNNRLTTYRGHTHVYPKFESHHEIEERLRTIIDRYNTILTYKIKKNPMSFEKIQDMFKLASWFLFNFLSIHPFSDGNGRLARILYTYSMGTICPFPCTIRFIKDHTDKGQVFLDCLIQSRDTQDMGNLTSLVIESCWHDYVTYYKHFVIQ